MPLVFSFPLRHLPPLLLQNAILRSKINIYKLLPECDCFDKLTRAGLASVFLRALVRCEAGSERRWREPRRWARWHERGCAGCQGDTG